MTAFVTAPVAVAELADGTFAYFYQGAILHEGVPAEEIERLIDLGLVSTEDGDVFLIEETPTDAPPAGGEVEKPKRVSPKDEWVSYAVSQGADQAEAEASTKDDLIALYGG